MKPKLRRDFKAKSHKALCFQISVSDREMVMRGAAGKLGTGGCGEGVGAGGCGEGVRELDRLFKLLQKEEDMLQDKLAKLVRIRLQTESALSAKRMLAEQQLHHQDRIERLDALIHLKEQEAAFEGAAPQKRESSRLPERAPVQSIPLTMSSTASLATAAAPGQGKLPAVARGEAAPANPAPKKPLLYGVEAVDGGSKSATRVVRSDSSRAAVKTGSMTWPSSGSDQVGEGTTRTSKQEKSITNEAVDSSICNVSAGSGHGAAVAAPDFSLVVQEKRRRTPGQAEVQAQAQAQGQGQRHAGGGGLSAATHYPREIGSESYSIGEEGDCSQEGLTADVTVGASRARGARVAKVVGGGDGDGDDDDDNDDDDEDDGERWERKRVRVGREGAGDWSGASEQCGESHKGERKKRKTSEKTVRVDVMRTLCRFELHGECKDSKCQHIHLRDFEGSRHRAAPVMSIKEAHRAAGCARQSLEQREAAVAAAAAAAASSEAGARGGQGSEGREEGTKMAVTISADCDGSGEGKHIVDGCDFVSLESGGKSDCEDENMVTSGDEDQGQAARWRYFSAEAKLAEIKARVRKEPKDVDAWLEMAALWLERGGAEGDEHALNALSHGLDVNNDSLQLWLAYLDLFDDSAPLPDVSEMAGHAVRLIPADVRLCIMQAQSQVSVDAALMCLERLEGVEVVEGRECSTESLIRDDAYLRVRGDLTLCAANVLCLAGRPGEAADRIRSKIAEMSDEPELWAWMVRVTAFESIGVEAGAMLGFGACRLLWSHQAWTRCDANSQCNGHNMAGRDPRGGRGGWDGAWAWKEASGEGGDVALAFEAAFFGLASSSVKERAGHIAARLRGEYVAWAACRAASAKWRIGAAVASGLAAVWPKELQQCCQRELEKLVLFLKPMTWGGEIFQDKGVGGALIKAIQSLSPQIMTVGNLELANACAWIQLHAGDESGALSSLGWGAMYESVDTAPEAEDGDAWRCNKILHSYLTGGLSKLEDEVDLMFPIDTDGCTQGLLGLCAQVFRILACFPKDVSTERIGAKLFRKMFCEDSDVRLRSKDRSRGTDRLRGTAPEAMVLQLKFNEVFFNVIDQASAEMKMIAMDAWAAGHHASNMHFGLWCAQEMCTGLGVDGAEVLIDKARVCTLAVKRVRRWAMRRDMSFWKTVMLTDVAKGCSNRAAVEGARKAMPTSLQVAKWAASLDSWQVNGPEVGEAEKAGIEVSALTEFILGLNVKEMPDSKSQLGDLL